MVIRNRKMQILDEVWRNEPITYKELAFLAGASQGTVRKIISRMEPKGWVEKVPIKKKSKKGRGRCPAYRIILGPWGRKYIDEHSCFLGSPLDIFQDGSGLNEKNKFCRRWKENLKKKKYGGIRRRFV